MRPQHPGRLVFGLLVVTTASAVAQPQPAAPANYGQPSQPGYQPLQPTAPANYGQPSQPGYQPLQPATPANYGQSSQPGYPTSLGVPATTGTRKRDADEMTGLYATSAVYGLGMGVWFSSELKIKDPGLFLIAPIGLGVTAPIGAYFLDRPSMNRGKPAAISAGLLLGAGEGLGIWGTERVTSTNENEWGFRGLSRAAALGATVGGVAGYLAGEFMEPPPTTSVLAVSGAVWGTAVGSMFGYGSTDKSWGGSNDRTAVAGLIGYNVGMLAAGGLGAAMVPSPKQIAWMWGGAGIGAAASLPVFLLYAGNGGPPARRGFIFMGTATTLGIIAGGVFSAGSAAISGKVEPLSQVAEQSRPSQVQVHGLVPMLASGRVGLSVFGSLE